ncbi:MAG: hypothetical protein EA417_09865 [Gammaproteobacteria bacterium]|nr:MAG: hypothetical protein EA417_09865 [Gammaproteobacteria bacterium]
MVTSLHPSPRPTGPVAGAVLAGARTGSDAIAELQAAFPRSRRAALQRSDGPFCSCNLFLIRSAPGAAVGVDSTEDLATVWARWQERCG